MRAPLSLLFLLACTCATGACGGPRAPWSVDEPSEPGPHELLDPVTRQELRAAVAAFEEQRLEVARARMVELVRWWGEDVHVAIWEQEIELAWREESEGGGDGEATDSPGEALRDEYRRRAEADPGALAWVLAARLEDDTHAARLLLERALEHDPAFPWAHYGLAHAHARAGEIPRALESLQRCFEHDPGHLPALRLYGWCAAQGGEPDRAIDAFETWLERSEEDLLATRDTRATVILDLALVHLAADRPERAEELIEMLASESVDEIRRLAALAAAEQAQGHPRAALETTDEALSRDPAALLPLVQRALILELWLGDVEASRAAWRRVLEISASEPDLAAGLQRFRAQLHLARLPRPEGIQEMAR